MKSMKNIYWGCILPFLFIFLINSMVAFCFSCPFHGPKHRHFWHNCSPGVFWWRLPCPSFFKNHSARPRPYFLLRDSVYDSVYLCWRFSISCPWSYTLIHLHMDFCFRIPFTQRLVYSFTLFIPLPTIQENFFRREVLCESLLKWLLWKTVA